MSQKEIRDRTLAIAAGTYKPKGDEPKFGLLQFVRWLKYSMSFLVCIFINQHSLQSAALPSELRGA